MHVKKQNQKQEKKQAYAKSLLSLMVASIISPQISWAQPEEPEVLEEIIVLGTFQRNLQNSLDIKRNSQNIVDGISADDIDALPALDMGEALQAVVGVQLNREAERRESSINLRGLPSGFVKNTVNGQSIASPTRSDAVFGGPTPFGSYDPSVFDGIDVYKSQSANFQEGGIAGIVNLRVGRALASDDGGSVGYGIRNEVLAGSNDEEIKFSGTKHLIEDVLAVTGTVAWSEQNFRRDTIKINRYDPMTEAGATNGSAARFAHPTLTYAQWLAQQGLPANAQVDVPGELRQATEQNSGDRLSYTTNLEFAPTDELKFGLSGLYTHRDMDRNGYEQLDLRTRYADVRPLSNALDTGQTDINGNPIYSVSQIAFGAPSPGVVPARGPIYAYDSRAWNLDELSKAWIFDAAWEKDNLTVKGIATRSDAFAEWNEVLVAPRNENRATNAITGTLGTGEGDVGDYYVTLQNFHQALDLDAITWVPRTTVTGSGLIPSSVAGGQPSILLTGTYERIDRDMQSVELSAEYAFDDFPITSLEAGVRFSEEEEWSSRLRISPAGVDPTGLLTNRDLTTPSYANGATYFGGEAPGFGGPEAGWFSFDQFLIWDRFVNSIDYGNVANDPATGEAPIILQTGFIARGGLGNRIANYYSELETAAFYGKLNYEVEFGSMAVTGNVGFRYIDDSQTATAPFYLPNGSGGIDLNNPANVTSRRDYDAVLPSLNVNFQLTDDVVARLAYEQSIVRPNNRAFTPTIDLSVNGTGDAVDLSLPPVVIDPFEASLINLSFEWYNREGSSLALALFTVDVDNYISAQEFCGSEALAGTNIDIGTLSIDGTGSCVTTGSAEFGIMAGAEVEVTRFGNIDSTIKVSGLELSAQQTLDFLPYPWDGFGGIVNYSKTDQDKDSDIFIPGISEDTFNLIGFYEQDSYGIRIAYNYRSEYNLESFTLDTFNGDGDKRVQAAGRVDLSAYYNVTDDLTVSLKGYNLTNTLYEEYEVVEFQPRAQHYDGQVWVLSASYSF